MGSEHPGSVYRRYEGDSGKASFFISITDDKMEAYIQIFGSGHDLTLEDIVAGVKDIGIKRGVSRKIVDAILEGHHGTEYILFARGIKPVDGDNGSYEFFFRTNLVKRPKILEDGSVDYQNVEWFEVVEEGQKLVQYHPAKEGTSGFDVYGNELKAKKGRDLPQLRGKGFSISEDKMSYYADMGGRIEYKDGKMDILRLFVVDELSRATGNLEFDGSVHVRGNIGFGITLKATEDIVIDGFVESANVECGGSVMFRQGMNASGEGSVKAEEYVAGKFFESVAVECNGEIQADYFLNCSLFAKEKIIVSGKKGSIAGGKAYAMLGFVTRNVGNRIGLKTFLRVGVNEDVLREQVDVENEIKQTAGDVNKFKYLRNEMESQYGKEGCLASKKYESVIKVLEFKENLLEQLYEKSDTLAEYIEKLRKANIVVNNMLYDGVVCELNNQKVEPSSVKNVTVKMVGTRIAIYENQTSE